MCLLLPLAESDIRCPVSRQVSAVDATPLREGATETVVPPAIAHGLYKLCEHKGIHRRMDWSPLQADLSCLKLQNPGPDIDDLFRALPWEVVCSKNFPQVHHVNIQEMSALSHKLVRLCQEPASHRQRRIVGADSQVAIGAWPKGRSSSPPLNRVMQRSMGFAVLSRITFCFLYVNTKSNPADAPSRNVELVAQEPLPAWCNSHFISVSNQEPEPVLQRAPPNASFYPPSRYTHVSHASYHESCITEVSRPNSSMEPSEPSPGCVLEKEWLDTWVQKS